jgi:hypothetical protein
MKMQSIRILLRPPRGALGWPGSVAAAAGAILLAAPGPAAAQTPCPATMSGAVDVPGYNFSYHSWRQPSGAGFLSVHCVRNRHGSRAVFVVWRGAGLRSAIPPGRTIFRASPLAGAASIRSFQLFYGARPNEISVPTVASAAGPPAASAWSAPGRFLVRRASFAQEPDAARGDADTSQVYIPVDLDFLGGFARAPLSDAALIEWLEDNPGQLRPFGMTFHNRVRLDAAGRAGIAYECRYRMPEIGKTRGAVYFLRFTDPILHRQMFGRDDPFPIQGWGGAETVLRATPPLGAGEVAPRTAQLEILLADRATAVASIPVTYSARSAR